MMLKKYAVVLSMGAALLAARGALAADAKPAEKPADKAAAEAKPEAKPSAAGVKLTKPWSDLTSLTDEQKLKIEAIHKKALAESNAIEKKEKEDILGVLTDAQKTELKDLADKKKKEAAGKRAEDKKAAEKADDKK